MFRWVLQFQSGDTTDRPTLEELSEDYVQTGKPLNFYTVVEAARRRNEVAICYRLQDQSQNVEKSYGVKLNPEKSVQVSYGKEDRIIVLADN